MTRNLPREYPNNRGLEPLMLTEFPTSSIDLRKTQNFQFESSDVTRICRLVPGLLKTDSPAGASTILTGEGRGGGGEGRKRGVFCLLPWIQRANPLFGRCLNFTFFHQLGDALFFSRFSVVRSTQIFGVFEKKKIYHFQEPISFEIILLIWKMSIVTAKKKTGTRTGTFFTVYCVSVVYPNMWMLTFNVVLGYQGILFQDFLWIFFRCFFF